jgi:phage terminase small subunit
MARNGALTLKQSRFVQEYLVDGNATQAAIRAGYSRKTAKSIATENLTKPAVQAALGQVHKDAAHRAGVTHERIMRELSRLAFTRIDEIVSWEGKHITLKDSSELTQDQLAAIVEIISTSGKSGSTLRVKLYSKQTALESLLKCLQALDLEARVAALEDAIGHRRNGYHA